MDGYPLNRLHEFLSKRRLDFSATNLNHDQLFYLVAVKLQNVPISEKTKKAGYVALGA